MSQNRVVLHPFCPSSVRSAFADSEDPTVLTPNPDELEAVLAESDVLVTFRWTDDYLVPGLRFVQSISVGVEQFPLKDLSEAGVVLASARGCHGPQVSEHVFALLLALTRGVGFAMRNAESRIWKPMQGDEISGRTIGVLGLGAIGEAIAEKAAAWDMRVIGTKGHPESYRGVAELVVPPSDTRTVFEKADIVVSVLPDTPKTRGIVSSDCLKALAGGWFINVGRGSAIAESTILEALDAGWVKGVGLDVFDEEPLRPESPLWAHPRVVLTPHTAGLSPRYGVRLMEILRTNLAALNGAGDWINLIG